MNYWWINAIIYWELLLFLLRSWWKNLLLCRYFTSKQHTPRISQNLYKRYAANLSSGIVISPDIFISQFIWPNDIQLNDLKTMKAVKMPSELKKNKQTMGIWYSFKWQVYFIMIYLKLMGYGNEITLIRIFNCYGRITVLLVWQTFIKNSLCARHCQVLGINRRSLWSFAT